MLWTITEVEERPRDRTVLLTVEYRRASGEAPVVIRSQHAPDRAADLVLLDAAMTEEQIRAELDARAASLERALDAEPPPPAASKRAAAASPARRLRGMTSR